MARFDWGRRADDWIGLQAEETSLEVSLLGYGRVWIEPHPLEPEPVPKKASKKTRRDTSPFPPPPAPLER